jgi:hypothetical protein
VHINFVPVQNLVFAVRGKAFGETLAWSDFISKTEFASASFD